MADRKTTRKATARKTVGKGTRKSATRKAGSARGRSASTEDAAKTLVAARDRAKRRARSQARRLQADRPEENRSFAETLGGTQFAPQGRRLPLGALDADLLYQPRRQGPAEDPTRAAGAGQGRIEAGVREGGMTWRLIHSQSSSPRKRGSSTPRPFGSTTDVSGILDHPLSRTAAGTRRFLRSSLRANGSQ